MENKDKLNKRMKKLAKKKAARRKKVTQVNPPLNKIPSDNELLRKLRNGEFGKAAITAAKKSKSEEGKELTLEEIDKDIKDANHFVLLILGGLSLIEYVDKKNEYNEFPKEVSKEIDQEAKEFYENYKALVTNYKNHLDGLESALPVLDMLPVYTELFRVLLNITDHQKVISDFANKYEKQIQVVRDAIAKTNASKGVGIDPITQLAAIRINNYSKPKTGEE